MEVTSADSIFYSNSGERLIRYYCQLIDELQDKLNPSDRYKLDQKISDRPSVESNLLLLKEAQKVVLDEWDNLVQVYQKLNVSNKHELLIQFVDGLLEFLNYQGEWVVLEKWLEQGIQTAELINDSKSAAAYRLELGWLASEKGDWKKADLLYTEAMNYWNESSSDYGKALANLRFGWLHTDKGDFDKAQDYFKKSLDLYEDMDHRIGIANARLGSGSVFMDIQEWEKAEQCINSALEIFSQIGDSTGVAAAYNNLARLAMVKGDLNLARKYYLSDLEIIEQIQDKQGFAITMMALGNLGVRMGELKSGLDYLFTAQSIFSDLGDRIGRAEVYRYIGLAYSKLKAFDKAIEYYQNAIKIIEELNDLQFLGETYRQIGLVYSVMGDDTQAQLNFSVAHEFFKKVEDPRSAVNGMIINLSNLLKNEEKYDSLIDFYETLKQKLTKTSNIRGLANVHAAIGDFYYFRGINHNQSLSSYQQSLLCFENLKETREIANIRGKLGDVQRNLRQPELAITQYASALPLLEASNDYKWLGWTNTSLGDCYAKIGENEKALCSYERALEASKKSEDKSCAGWSNLNMAEVFQKLNRCEEAILKFQVAVSVGLENDNFYISGWAYHHIGEIYQKNDDMEKARLYFQKSDHIWRQIPHPWPLRKNLTSLGKVLMNIGQYEKAIETLNEVLKITMDIGDTEDIGDSYIELAEAFQKMNRYEDALIHYELAQKKFTKINNSRKLRYINYQFSQIYKARAEWEMAISYYVNLISNPGDLTAGALGDLYWFLGDAYFENGQLELAVESYQKGLEKYTTLSDQAAIVSIALGMASVYGKLGLVDKEIESNTLALVTAEKAQLLDFLSSIQKWLANSYFNAGMYDQALKYYQISFASFEKNKNMEESVKVLGKIALTYSRLGDQGTTINQLNAAISTLQKIDDMAKREELISYLRFLFNKGPRSKKNE